MSLYLKHRPTSLLQIKGNDQIIKALTGLLSNRKTCPHAFLLYGPTGCGKTTIARIISTELGCAGTDYREVDSADFRGIDTIREIRKNSSFRAIEGEVRVWTIDECHKLTNDAQNALLKLLEDTPPHVFIILCTTEPQKLLPTIKGRCSQFQVVTLNDQQLFSLLRKVVRDEGAELDKEIYDQIIQTSLGHPRNALNILEQVLSVPKEEQLEISKKNLDNQTEIIELCKALIKDSSWNTVKEIIAGLKDQDAESIRRVVLGYCQAILLKGENDRAAYIIENFWEPTYDLGFPYITYVCYLITKNK
jgi:DNA polymerase-3 subunit gamma/tau